jgi:hypothetical protein
VRGGAGFLVNDSGSQTVLRRQESGHHAHRAGANHKDFDLAVLWHKLIVLIKVYHLA